MALIRWGAFWVLSAPPLLYAFVHPVFKTPVVLVAPTGSGPPLTHVSFVLLSWQDVVIPWALWTAVLLPSLLGSFASGFPRATLAAFLPLASLLAYLAYAAASAAPLFGPMLVRIPTALAVLPAAAAALIFVGGGLREISRPALARFARASLAACALWVFLIEVAREGGLFYPAWAGAAGAVLILTGELASPPVVR